MMPLVVRVLKRLLVLAFGAGIVYLAVWQVFPFFDNRVPAALALLATYIVMAYIVIPALFRGIRLFYQPSHIPLYCTTPDGFASDPINIGLVGTKREVMLAMKAAGWELADRHSLVNVMRAIASTLLRQPYPNAPMSTLYLFGRKQDLGFEVELTGTLGHRHHVRFWATNVETPQEFEHHVKFYRRFYRTSKQHPQRRLWVGAASKDTGFAPIRHNAQLTHMIDPDTNSERERIVTDLKNAGKLANSKTILIHKPYILQNRALNGVLRSDGRITICRLK